MKFEYKGHDVEILRTGDLKTREQGHWEKWTFSIDGKIDWSSAFSSVTAVRNAKGVINQREKI